MKSQNEHSLCVEQEPVVEIPRCFEYGIAWASRASPK